LYVSLVAAIGVTVSGDLQARIMTRQQPMKMAAAEALYNTSAPASFSLFTVGSLDGGQEMWSVRVPHVLSFMATGKTGGTVEGINDLQRQYEQKYGAGSYKPVVPVTYWSFRFMIGFGFLAGLLALAGLWLTRRGRIPGSPWFIRSALACMALPFLANSMGWIFTEMGRQPWVVFGVLKTRNGVSPSVGTPSVIISLTVLTLLYAVLAVVAGALMVRYVRLGPAPEGETPAADEPMPAFQY
jgi:cytochrome d ubiquinol oxidase subunit I